VPHALAAAGRLFFCRAWGAPRSGPGGCRCSADRWPSPHPPLPPPPPRGGGGSSARERRPWPPSADRPPPPEGVSGDCRRRDLALAASSAALTFPASNLVAAAAVASPRAARAVCRTLLPAPVPRPFRKCRTKWRFGALFGGKIVLLGLFLVRLGTRPHIWGAFLATPNPPARPRRPRAVVLIECSRANAFFL